MSTVSQQGKGQGGSFGKTLRHKGFTFMEILVCLSCIVALGVGASYVAGEALRYSRYNTARSDMAIISAAVSQYYFEVGSMPANLNALTSKNGQYGPWLTSDALKDPWGNAYVFRDSPAEKNFLIYCYDSHGGPDLDLITTYQ